MQLCSCFLQRSLLSTCLLSVILPPFLLGLAYLVRVYLRFSCLFKLLLFFLHSFSTYYSPPVITKHFAIGLPLQGLLPSESEPPGPRPHFLPPETLLYDANSSGCPLGPSLLFHGLLFPQSGETNPKLLDCPSFFLIFAFSLEGGKKSPMMSALNSHQHRCDPTSPAQT